MPFSLWNKLTKLEEHVWRRCHKRWVLNIVFYFDSHEKYCEGDVLENNVPYLKVLLALPYWSFMTFL